MKLSEIKGERVFDVMAEIIDPIVNIAQDEAAADIFRPKEKPEDVEPWDFFLSRLKGSLPSLIRGHKEDLVKIMSSVNGVSEEEYVKNLTLPNLVADIIELFTDKEFSSFF